MAKKREKYSEEFKSDAVRMMRNRGERSVGQVADDLGVPQSALYRWAADVDEATVWALVPTVRIASTGLVTSRCTSRGPNVARMMAAMATASHHKLPTGALLVAVLVCVACGNTDGGAGQTGGATTGGDATGGASTELGAGGAAGDVGRSAAGDSSAAGGAMACDDGVDAVIAGGCTRCWPAGRAMCTAGNPGALLGMLHCLTNGTCWDEGDPNSALPCMQRVIDEYGDANVSAVQTQLKALGCSSESAEIAAALAVEMSKADRATFAQCLAGIVSGDACASAPSEACLAKTHYQAALCQN